MLFSRKISILAICTLIATVPATSFADEKIKDPEVGTIDILNKATSNEGSTATTVLSRHYIDKLHVNGAQISNEDSNVANNLRFYGTSSTAASVSPKTVNIPSITKLEPGQVIVVTPTTTSGKITTGISLKLNDFAQYPMKYNGAAVGSSYYSTVWVANVPTAWVFDGASWVFLAKGVDSNTTYSGMTQAEITATTPTTTNRLVSPQLLRQNLARRPQNEAVGSATKPVYVAEDGMVTEVTHELNADVPSTAVFTDTVTTVKNSDGTDGASTAADGSVQVTKDGTTTYPVVQGWASKENVSNKVKQGTSTTSIFSNTSTDDEYPSAKAVYTALNAQSTDISGKQDKDNNEIYKVGYNGDWTDLSTAVTVDTTYLKNSNSSNTNKSVQVAIDTSKMTTSGTSGLSNSSTKLVQEKAIAQALALKQNKLPYDATANLIIAPTTDGGNATKRAITTAGANITNLASSSATGATNIPTAYAVKEAIGTATSGMITDVSGKQDKDNNEVYKVGYNGGWANASTAVAVDTTYLDKTNNDNGSVTVKVDTTKLASAKANITDLTSSSTDANKGKLTTAYAVKQSLDDKQNKLPYDATANLIIAPTTDGGNATKRAIATAGTDITGLTSSSTDANKIKIPTAYAVKQGLDGKQQKITHSSTNKVVITPTTDGGATGTRDITTAGANITNLASSSATGATNIPTAYAVKEAITSATSGMITDVSGKQDKDNNQIYKVGYNGGWENAYNAIGVDTTYLKKTDNSTTGATEVAVDSTKLASANANITSLTSSSTAADKGKLTTAWAVNQAIDNDINHFAKSHFVNAAPLTNENSVYWGMSATSGSTAAKTVRIDSLEQVAINPGVFVIITPKYPASVAISTLDVNDSGAFKISYNGSTTISAADSGKIWKAGVPSMFVLNADKEWAYVGSDTDTTYTQGSGITISGTTITNAGVRDIKNPDNTTASTTIADGTILANINGTVRYPKVRGWDKTVKYDGTNAVGSLARGVWVDTDGTVKAMTHSVNADVPSTAEFTDTTYTFATGTTNGAFTVTPEGGSAQTVSVYGWSTKQNKPNKSGENTAAEGKVLTYTSNSLDNNVAARYIQVPVATGDPNNGGTVNSTTPLASIWVE